MNRTILSIISIAALVGNASSDTYVYEGEVFGTWTPAGSPYLIMGTITVPTWGSLVIEPGVDVVILSPSFRIEVHGQLRAEGTITDSIAFNTGNLDFMDTDTSSQDSSILSYCKISNGVGPISDPMQPWIVWHEGGAIYVSNSSRLRISQSLITQCRSSDIIGEDGFTYQGWYGTPGDPGESVQSGSGGAIYIVGSSPIIESCTFFNNHTGNAQGGDGGDGEGGYQCNGGDGGHGGSATSGRGGAIFVQSFSPIIRNNKFFGNFTGHAHGGDGGDGGSGGSSYGPAYGGDGGWGGNGVAGSGGAIASASMSALISNNLIAGEYLGLAYGGTGGVGGLGVGWGGGGSGSPGSPGSVIPGTGHALFGSAEIQSCTITGNGYTGGGALAVASYGPTVSNCIVWGNADPEISAPQIAYSCIEGGYAGLGNIADNPLFVSGTYGNYYLSQISAGQSVNSPCVDAGNPLAVMILGTTRTDSAQDGDVLDMGYHYPPATPPVEIFITPINPPIQIPNTGGRFEYGLTAINRTDDPVACDFWMAVTLPNGSQHDPIEAPLHVLLPSDSSLSRSRAQAIPAEALVGTYICEARIGIFPDSIWDTDSFSFEKMPPPEPGDELWVARYDGPAGDEDKATCLAVDGSGNVYVTGSSYATGSSYDYATVRYNSDGVEQWVARYNGPGAYSDTPTSLAVDGSGNVLVTGQSHLGGYNYEWATVKYNQDGVQQWVAAYDQGTCPFSLAVDRSGNIYVAGNSHGGGSEYYDFGTIKYNPDGVQLWMAIYNGPENASDAAKALVLDEAGNIYVTGYSHGGGSYFDYATIKYNPEGSEQWVARYNGPAGNCNDHAKAIAVDESGNVYVTGQSYLPGLGYDYATVKYDRDGVELWVARYNGPGNGADSPVSIAVNGSGDVYVIGRSFGGPSSSNYDYATIKYNFEGVEQWVARYCGSGNDDDGANALALDGAGNVYVTGYSYETGLGTSYTTIKYNSGGVVQWISQYNEWNSPYAADMAADLALDGEANVYVTGTSEALGTYNLDYATVKYAAGNLCGWGDMTAIVLGSQEPVREFRLNPNFPNPFNAATALSYQLSVACHVRLALFDITGRTVMTLLDGWRDAGTHQVTLDGSILSSGIYFAKLKAGDYSQVQKLVLLK